MLQAATLSLLAPVQSSKSNPSPVEETHSWQKHNYYIYPHRKTGYMMASQAVNGMQDEFGKLTSLGQPTPSVNFMLGDDATKLSSGWRDMQSKQLCLLHLARNPFEIVVSGYLFNKANSEHWTGTPLGKMQGLKPLRPLHMDQAQQKVEEAQSGVPARERFNFPCAGKLLESSLSGPFSDVLPDANASETYPEYLQRVDLDSGLIAEFLFDSCLTFGNMQQMHDLTSSQPCSIETCFNEYFDDCSATWQRVIKDTWHIPEPQYSAMHRGAMTSCPGVSVQAESHSSSEHLKQAGFEHPPEHEMVKRLRDLDVTVFNGTIAATESYIQCPVSGKYKAPA